MTIERTMRVGRRKKGPAEKLVLVSVRISPEAAAALRPLGRHKGAWLREVIEAAARERFSAGKG